MTSLIWFLMDVFLLMYFTDCTNSRESRSNDCNAVHSGVHTGTGIPPSLKPTPAPTPGPVAHFFNRIIPDGRRFCHDCD